MSKNISLDIKEITTILINAFCIRLFFTFPKKVVVVAGNAGWLNIVYVSLIVFGLFFLTTLAYKNCGTAGVLEISEKIGGKPFKTIVGLSVIAVLFLGLAGTLRSYLEMVKMVLLPNTPIEIILGIFAVVIGLTAYAGLESIARIHSLFVPVVLAILGAFFVFLFPHIKITNIFPIMGKGTYNIFVRGIENIDLFDDFLILNLLLPYIKNADRAKKAGKRAIIISSVVAFFVLLLYCLVYPYPSSEKFLVPIYQLTRLVGIGDFFQRFEAFFEFVWSFSVFLYSALYTLTICIVLKDTFNLKYEKPLIPSVISIITILSFTSYSMQEIVFNYWYLSLFIILVSFGLPIFIPLIFKKTKTKG